MDRNLRKLAAQLDVLDLAAIPPKKINAYLKIILSAQHLPVPFPPPSPPSSYFIGGNMLMVSFRARRPWSASPSSTSSTYEGVSYSSSYSSSALARRHYPFIPFPLSSNIDIIDYC